MSQPQPPRKKILKNSTKKPSIAKEAPAQNQTPPPSKDLGAAETEKVPETMTPDELVNGLTRVVEQLKDIMEHPTHKPLTGEVGTQMEKIQQMSGFLSAIYANMIRIEVEEKGTPPALATPEQRDLAAKAETLGWAVRALQEKAAIQMAPPTTPPVSAKKRKSRMERTQGDGQWKRM